MRGGARGRRGREVGRLRGRAGYQGDGCECARGRVGDGAHGWLQPVDDLGDGGRLRGRRVGVDHDEREEGGAGCAGGEGLEADLRLRGDGCEGRRVSLVGWEEWGMVERTAQGELLPWCGYFALPGHIELGSGTDGEVGWNGGRSAAT